jgi:hypothetical protein
MFIAPHSRTPLISSIAATAVLRWTWLWNACTLSRAKLLSTGVYLKGPTYSLLLQPSVFLLLKLPVSFLQPPQFSTDDLQGIKAEFAVHV